MCSWTEPPFTSERAQIFRALELHIELVLERVPGTKLWLNGGFVTHKDWGAPHDADLAYFVPLAQALRARQPDMLNLWTSQGVSVVKPRIDADRVQPMGGLVDAFFTVEMPAQVEIWHNTWSKVKGADGILIPGKKKGFVEVIV